MEQYLMCDDLSDKVNPIPKELLEEKFKKCEKIDKGIVFHGTFGTFNINDLGSSIKNENNHK